MNGSRDRETDLLETVIENTLADVAKAGKQLLGIGVDVVDIQRFRQIQQRWGDRFQEKIFTQSEIEYCQSKSDPGPSFAGTFAAKESVFKALGLQWNGAFSWLWVRIDRDQKGAPVVHLHDELLANHAWLRCARVVVSISHAGEYAAAVAASFCSV